MIPVKESDQIQDLMIISISLLSIHSIETILNFYSNKYDLFIHFKEIVHFTKMTNINAFSLKDYKRMTLNERGLK